MITRDAHVVDAEFMHQWIEEESGNLATPLSVSFKSRATGEARLAAVFL
jgi:hypothetical protein